MQNWVRSAVMMIAIVVWAVVVLASVVRGILPDAITWGFPGAIWFAMNPTLPKRDRRPDARHADKGPTTGEIKR